MKTLYVTDLDGTLLRSDERTSAYTNQIINQLVAEGKAVLMISSELPELLGMSDRIYVMNEGRLIAEMPTKEATQEIIMGHIMQDSKGEIGA